MSFLLLSHVFRFVLMQKNRQRILSFNLMESGSMRVLLHFYEIIGVPYRPGKGMSHQSISVSTESTTLSAKARMKSRFVTTEHE